MSSDLDRARHAKSVLLGRYRDAPWWRGVGVVPREQTWCLRLDVAQARTGLPAQVEGVPVEVHVVGDVTLQPETD